jgi:hypothetical protein
MRVSSDVFAHSRLPRRRRELSVQSWTAHRAPALAQHGVLTSISGPFGTPAAPFSARYIYAALYRAPVLGERGERRAHGRQARGARLQATNGCAYPQRLRSSATAALIRNGCAHPQRLRSSATAALICNGCAYHNGCAYPQRLRLSATAALIRNGCAYPQRLRLSATAALICNGCAYPQPTPRAARNTSCGRLHGCVLVR